MALQALAAVSCDAHFRAAAHVRFLRANVGRATGALRRV